MECNISARRIANEVKARVYTLLKLRKKILFLGDFGCLTTLQSRVRLPGFDIPVGHTESDPREPVGWRGNSQQSASSKHGSIRDSPICVYGLVDAQSRPIVAPDHQGSVQFCLFGAPVFVTPAILENLTYGSTSNTSWVAFTNPRYLHIAEPSAVELMVSADYAFASY